MKVEMRSPRLGTFLNAGIGTAFMMAAVLVVITVNYSMRQQAILEAQSKARLILDRNFATHTYFSQIMKPSIFAWSEPFRPEEYFDPTWMSSTYAIREIEKYFKSFSPSGYFFKDAALNARSPENEADEYERPFLEKLSAEKKFESESTIREIGGEPYLVLLRKSEIVEESCLRCHGDPKDAPKGLTDYYGSERSFDRKTGDVFSAVSLRIPLSEAYATANLFSVKLSAILLIILGCLFTIQSWFYRRYLLRPLNVLKEKAAQIATHEEHLGEQVSQPFGRELNELATAFSEMSVRVRHGRDHLEELVDKRTRALQQSEARLDLALRSAQMGVWYWDIIENRRHFDDQVCHLLGIEQATFTGSEEEFFGVVHPEDREKLKAALARTIEQDVLYEPEYRTVWPDGSAHFITARGRVVRDDQGRPLRINGILWDITERKQVEQEKEKLEAQLRQAQKMEAIGTLAGGIAHDFNNILGIIMGYVEIVRSTFSKESREKRSLGEALKACGRAKELVQQILVFSRMEGRIERRPVNLGTLIKETLGFLRATLPSTIEIRRDLSDKDLLVSANATQIQQVVTNLCTNAAHAMEDTGGILEVSLTEVDFDSGAVLPRGDIKPGPYVKLAVSDTGRGMDAWTLERIFDPYFTTKEVGKGTGLGLSVVQGIVKHHEGAITIRSEPGQGTTFDVYLPRIESQTTTEVEVEKFLPKGMERILFVDDEAALADIGRMGLEYLGYAVVAKTDSVEALELFRAQPEQFDLVITDYTMPRMTGMELAKAMMRIKPDVPVILCTGYNEMISEEAAKNLGICAFLEKPVSVRGIAETIREVLESRKS